MKKLILVVIAIMILGTLCSCENGTEADIQLMSNANVEVIDVQKDQYDHVISKSVYNAITQQTTIYTYTYEHDFNGFWECSNIDIVVISKAGTVIYPKGD